MESIGLEFTSAAREAFPKLSPTFESTVPGIYVIGALAGYPLIKHCINQGYDVVEYIGGAVDLKPADEPILEARLKGLPGPLQQSLRARVQPVTVEAARRCGISPAKVLMPMAFGAMLGGLITLIGTPPNLLVNIALEESGRSGFKLFDFALIGLPVLLAGTLFVAFIGRHLLPETDPGRAGLAGSKNLSDQYSLQERIFALRLPDDSLLAGRTLDESGLINTAGLIVIALTRGSETFTLPSRHTALQGGDIVLAQGKFSRFERLRSWNSLTIEREAPMLHEKLLEKQLDLNLLIILVLY